MKKIFIFLFVLGVSSQINSNNNKIQDKIQEVVNRLQNLQKVKKGVFNPEAQELQDKIKSYNSKAESFNKELDELITKQANHWLKWLSENAGKKTGVTTKKTTLSNGQTLTSLVAVPNQKLINLQKQLQSLVDFFKKPLPILKS